MKAIIRLKTQARLHEQREEWEKAAQLYLQVLEAGEDAAEEQDLSLYNRVGDLYLRLRRPREAVQYFEQAADRYAAAGLYNNAIALCNKALRQVPEQLDLYRKLGELYALQGFLPEARRWYLDYTEWRVKAGEVEAALAALAQFAEITNSAEARELYGRKLAQHGRADSAVEELGRAYRLRVAAGEDAVAEAVRADVERIDAAAAARLAAEPPAPPQAPTPTTPLDTDFGEIQLESAADAAGLAFDGPPTAAQPELSGDDSLDVEPTAMDFESNLEELKLQGALDAPAPEPVDAAPLPDLEAMPSDLGLGDDFAEIEPIPLLDVENGATGEPVASEDVPPPLDGLDFGTLAGGPDDAEEEALADELPFFPDIAPVQTDGRESDDEEEWTELPLLEGTQVSGGGLAFAPEDSPSADEPDEDAPVELPLLEIPGFDPVPASTSAPRPPEPPPEIPDLPFLEAPGLADLTPLPEPSPESADALPDLEGTLSYARMLERRGDLESAIATLRDLHDDLTAAGRAAEAAEAAAELARLRPHAPD